MPSANIVIGKVVDDLCNDIRELGKGFEIDPSNGNPIEAAVNYGKADLCCRLAETIRLSLTGKEE